MEKVADGLKLVCFNFLFTFFTQLFFIQPAVRTIFKFLFAKDLINRNSGKDNPTIPI